MKKTMVIGATENISRYAYSAVKSLRRHHHEVVAIGLKEGKIDDVEIITEHPDMSDINTVTLYVGPKNQDSYYDYLIKLKPKRIIFNPGTENPILEHMARENGIEAIQACTLVMLSIGSY